MRKLTRFATPLMAVAIMTSVPFMALAQNSPQGNQNQNQTNQDWNTPPAGTEQAQAFRDGIAAAQLDKAANRKIDAKASHLYTHPPVKGAAKDAYRNSFESGYQAAVKHNSAS